MNEIQTIYSYIQLKKIIMFDLEIKEKTRPRKSRAMPIKALLVSSALNIDLLFSIWLSVSKESTAVD